MRAVLASGNSPFAFAESTRWHTGPLKRFQSSAFRGATSAGVPVVTLYIDCTRQMMPSVALLPMRFSWNGITIMVHELIPTVDRSIDKVKQQAFKVINSRMYGKIETFKIRSWDNLSPLTFLALF